ncbi:hypothetical protein FK220_009765 [Flavobacteriaceae bacterium TP-CH-4]|uniref:Uncharacterized protein n=1 Tax=Pelagihabitans pacificus TaxID=2696054 RepID=A0A967E5P1_9FLAO|nr:DUF6327 family protein [Pelagihabitans pacificus]NHF59627.1 hypothetical protein [Pelagihabitans pacificus]
MKRYSSFEEVDTRLRVLELQREIDKENLKLNLNSARTNLLPSQLRSGLGLNDTLKKLALTFVLKKVLKRYKDRRDERLLEQRRETIAEQTT